MAAPRMRAGSSSGGSRWSAMIDVYSYPCVPATSASTGPAAAPLADRHRDAGARVDAVRHLDPAGRQLAGRRGRASNGEVVDMQAVSFQLCRPLGRVPDARPRVSPRGRARRPPSCLAAAALRHTPGASVGLTPRPRPTTLRPDAAGRAPD